MSIIANNKLVAILVRNFSTFSNSYYRHLFCFPLLLSRLGASILQLHRRISVPAAAGFLQLPGAVQGLTIIEIAARKLLVLFATFIIVSYTTFLHCCRFFCTQIPDVEGHSIVPYGF